MSAMKDRTHMIILSVVLSVILMPGLGYAQEEDLPSLRVDRLPTLPAFVGQTHAPAAEPSTYQVETLLSGLSFPRGMAVLPTGDILLTEERRNGLRIFSADGKLSEPLSGMPAVSQHPNYPSFGWFEVVVDPYFTVTRRIYFSYYAMAGDDPEAPGIARVARARLSQDHMRLEDLEVILDGKGTQEIHFAPDGTLMITGEGDFSADPQALSGLNGKILRINADGSIPDNNPFRSDPDVPQEIYTRGHRDVSGLDNHPVTGEVWVSGHGHRGGDELNIIRAGANYGWKVISYGTEYNGKEIGDGTGVLDGMRQPAYFWRPGIAPSGLMFYAGEMFPAWRTSLFVTALSGAHLTRLVIQADRVIAEERFLVDRADRIREVRQAPDGALYVLTSEASGTPPGTAEC